MKGKYVSTPFVSLHVSPSMMINTLWAVLQTAVSLNELNQFGLSLIDFFLNLKSLPCIRHCVHLAATVLNYLFHRHLFTLNLKPQAKHMRDENIFPMVQVISSVFFFFLHLDNVLFVLKNKVTCFFLFLCAMKSNTPISHTQ